MSKKISFHVRFPILIGCSIFYGIILYILYFLIKELSKKINSFSEGVLKNIALKILHPGFLKVFLSLFAISLSFVIFEIYKAKVNRCEKFTSEDSSSQNIKKQRNFLLSFFIFDLIIQILTSIVRVLKDTFIDKINGIRSELILLFSVFCVIALYKSITQFLRFIKIRSKEISESFEKSNFIKLIKKTISSIYWLRFLISIIIFAIFSVIAYFIMKKLFNNKKIENISEWVIKIGDFELKFFSLKFFLMLSVDLILFFIIDLFVCEVLKKYDKSRVVRLGNQIEFEEKKMYEVRGKYFFGTFAKFVFAAGLTSLVSICQSLDLMNLDVMKNPLVFSFVICCLSFSFICSFYGMKYMIIDDRVVIDRLLEVKNELSDSIINLFGKKKENAI